MDIIDSLKFETRSSSLRNLEIAYNRGPRLTE